MQRVKFRLLDDLKESQPTVPVEVVNTSHGQRNVGDHMVVANVDGFVGNKGATGVAELWPGESYPQIYQLQAPMHASSSA